MELTLDQALQKGIEAHKAGKVEEADQYYTAILKANPKHPDANHNMGVLAVGVGKVEQALPFFKTALEVNQTIAQFWLSYIDALIKLDRIEDAKGVFAQSQSKGLQGEGFDQLAAEFSDDPGSKQEGGRLGWAGEGKYTEAFEEVMMRSNLNEVSLPFRSDFGWHILEVTGTRIEDKTNERIADQAFNYLYSRKFEEELESDLQELRAEAFIEIKDY